jgi:bacterioferritin (cytochrome b1)
MREYVSACASHDNAARTRRLLERIVVHKEAHARFVNTLARLEYVGVRKILKSRYPR